MDVTITRFLRYLVILFFIVVTGWLLYSLSFIITILIIATLIAYILDPIASYFEARGLSRTTATVIIFLLIFLIIGLGSWLLLPGLFRELITLQNTLSADATNDIITSIEQFLKDNFRFLETETLDLSGKLDDLLSFAAEELLIFLSSIVSILSAVVIVPFIVFFLLRDGRNMKKTFISYVPNRYFEMTLNFLHKIDQQLGGYLRGQFFEAFVVGLLSVIALWILDVKYFTIIGIFAGLANMIPYVGPFAGAIPAIVVTIIHDGNLSMVLYVIMAFVLIQIIDNVVLQPTVLSRSVNLHPLTIVLAILVGGQFFGLLGMLLAVPAAGILKVTASELYKGIRKFRLI